MQNKQIFREFLVLFIVSHKLNASFTTLSVPFTGSLRISIL